MDLVESQYQSLIENAREKSNLMSLETLQEMHEKVLKNIISGCFLDDSGGALAIAAAIDDVLSCVNRTCTVVEGLILSDFQIDTEKIQNIDSLRAEMDRHLQFLFDVFDGIQSSSRSLLSQFLVRLDYNKYFSLTA